MQKSGLPAIRDRIDELLALEHAFEQKLDKLEDPNWKWLTEEYLPAELRRIRRQRDEISPSEVEKQWEIKGQINQIKKQQKTLAEMRNSLDTVHSELVQARKAESKWMKKHGGKKHA